MLSCYSYGFMEDDAGALVRRPALKTGFSEMGWGSTPPSSANFLGIYNMSYFGYHLMLDCSGCSGIDSRENIYNFTKELIKEIDMVAHGEPIIEYLLSGDPKQGFSLMQLITTSNIVGHFMELSGTAYFDVFSCKEFEVEIVKNVVKNYFSPEKMRVNFITRHAD